MIKMVKVVLIHKNLNVGVKKFIVISRKTDKIIGAANSQKALEKLLKGKPIGSYFILEKPKVREASIMSQKAATVKHWKKSREAKKNLSRQYKKILFG